MFDVDDRTQTIVRGVTHLIATGGMAAVTMRAIAAATGVSQASLAVHLRNRQHLLQVVAHRFGTQLVDDISLRSHSEGVLAWLPSTTRDLDGRAFDDIRVWLAWCDLARSNDGVANAVAAVADQELRALAQALTRRIDPLDLGDARALLHRLVQP